MELDCQVQVNDLPEDVGQKIGVFLAKVALAFEEAAHLDLRRLHRIIVTADLGKELVKLYGYEAIGLTSYTRNDYALAVARMVILPVDEDYEIAIVLKDSAVLNLMGPAHPDAPSPEYIVHLFHHELCHVHDINKRIEALGADQAEPYRGKDSITFPTAISCWTEYIANYLATPSATTENVEDTCGLLQDSIVKTQEQVNQDIMSYRCHHYDLNRLLELFSDHGLFPVRTAAYVLGYVDGLGKGLDELSPALSKALAKSFFAPTWDAMHTSLELMRKMYPANWKDPSVFSGLAEVIEGYYSSLGLILSTQGDFPFVDIPMTPETNPLLRGWL